MIARLLRQHPGITIHGSQAASVSQQHHELRERKLDLVLGRVSASSEDDIDTEILFDDHTFVVASARNKWARRRNIQLSELANEPWTLPPPDTLAGSLIDDAFRASGVKRPSRGVATGSTQLLSALVASGPFIVIVPGSFLRFSSSRLPLKVLPVELSIPPSPVGIMTLKNRMQSPAVKLFIDCAREVARPLAKLK